MRKIPESARAATQAHDPFTFSLGGIRTIASFTPAPAIAAGQINDIRDERGRCARTPRRWIPGRRRVAACTCP